jgi:hypothetical protein
MELASDGWMLQGLGATAAGVAWTAQHALPVRCGTALARLFDNGKNA